MKVKYIIDDIRMHRERGLSSNEVNYYSKWFRLPDKFRLTYGKSYTVYGIQCSQEGFVNFMLVDDSNVSYPDFFPMEFFEIIDDRCSKCWVGSKSDRFTLNEVVSASLVTFPEVLENAYFFDEILDCLNSSCEIFASYKTFMDNEFPNEELETAIVFYEDWLKCPYCEDVWECLDHTIGVLQCPSCNKSINSPLWR